LSHNCVTVYFDHGVHYFGEYSGTSDTMLPEIFATPEERDARWRSHDWNKPCLEPDACQKEHCTVECHYGGPEQWHGEACRKCGRYLGPFDLYNDDVEQYNPAKNEKPKPHESK
jgi:hypothetical protein